MNIETTCIIEDGYNTSYIDSLFISMFFQYSDFDYLLCMKPHNIKFMMLQELIYYKFVIPVKSGYCIQHNILNEIRNYLFLCGWNNNNGLNFIEEQNIVTFFTYLMDNLNGQKIKGNIINNYYIELCINNDTTIKNLLVNWYEHNSSIIYEAPLHIPLYINRYEDNIKNNHKVDIMKKIMLPVNNTIDNNPCCTKFKWCIQSIICNDGNTVNTGHYYCIVNINDKWILFDNRKFPTFEYIDIRDATIKNNIQTNCVFLFYTLKK